MRILCLTLLLLPLSQLHAQIKLRDYYILGSADLVSIGNLPNYINVGLRGELMLSKSIGSEISFSGGRDNLHVGLGILSPLALILANTNGNSEGGSIAGLVLFLVCAASFVENTNYHIRITDNFEIVPFISLARFRYMYDRIEPFYQTDQFVSWSLGTKFSLLTKNNMVINLSAERTQLYHIGRPAGIQAGIHMGYLFRSKAELD